MIPDWTIEVYGFRLTILWSIYDSRLIIVKKLYDSYGAMYDQSMIKLIGKPGCFYRKNCQCHCVFSFITLQRETWGFYEPLKCSEKYSYYPEICSYSKWKTRMNFFGSAEKVFSTFIDAECCWFLQWTPLEFSLAAFQIDWTVLVDFNASSEDATKNHCKSIFKVSFGCFWLYVIFIRLFILLYSSRIRLFDF